MDGKCTSGSVAKYLIVGVIRISEGEFHQLNASKHAVKVPPEFGGGFMALPEFIHQIHCVVRPLRGEYLIENR